MTSLPCERCGKPGTVQLSSVPPNRAGVVQPAAEHRYCRDCARAAGVPIPGRRTHASVDDAPQDWASLREFCEMAARIPLTDPVQRATLASDMAEMLRMVDQLPEPPPPDLRALLEHLARGAA